jgi:hypothetical protein
MANQHFFDFLGGVNPNISPLIIPSNYLTIADGVNTSYRLGGILKDTGYSRVGDVASAAKPITGLHNFRQSSSTQKILRTRNDDTGANLLLQYNNAGTWTNINVGSTYDAYEDSVTEMEDFLGYCFIVGYDSTDNVWLPPASLTGTTFSASVNVTSMPNAKYTKRYRDRLYIGNCYNAGAQPYRVYFSSVPTAGAITWTTATDFLEVDYSEAVTGLGENWDRLMIFTEYSAYMYDQSQKKKVWDTGCSNHRTIANSGQYMMWANADGVWRSTGGQPENISAPVIDFIRNSNPRGFFGKVVDEEYHLFVGNVTVQGVSYANCLLTYNIPTSMWRWRELYHTPTVMEKYNSSGTQRLYFGTSIGEVYDKCKYTDATLISSDGYIDTNNTGYPIHALFELAPVALGDYAFTKNMTKITTFADRAMGIKLKARVLNRNSKALTPYIELGEVTSFVQHHHISVKDGVLLQIAGYEYSKNPYFSFFGFDLEADLLSEVLK